MTRAPVVFLGPTIPAAEAAAMLPPGDIRPPAAIGDVYRAVRGGAATILIIDGFFDSVPAVWHKEILYALQEGVVVRGCSSMGALRAAELHRYGMVGTGQIFEMYRDGTLCDDDEVAVAHTSAESGYRAVSHAMVNIRYGLSVAAAGDLISTETALALAAYGKQKFYPDRHWATLIDAGRRHGLDEAELDGLLAFVRTEKPDLKRLDAEEGLRALSLETVPASPAPTGLLVTSHAWTQFEQLEGN